MDRLSQHTSSEPVPSLPRDELDQDYLEPSLDQDLDQDHEAEYQRFESDSTPSKTVELKVLCTQQYLVSASSYSFLISNLWKRVRFKFIPSSRYGWQYVNVLLSRFNYLQEFPSRYLTNTPFALLIKTVPHSKTFS